jgi:hypothetical protein
MESFSSSSILRGRLSEIRADYRVDCTRVWLRPPRNEAWIFESAANAVDPVRARGRSKPRCRRKPLPLGASALVVNAIVFDGRTLRLAVPDGNRACGLSLEHNLSDRIADELRDTAPRARRGHAQRVARW